MNSRLPLLIGTVSFLVPRASNPTHVYAIKFRTKHNGGLGEAGGRWKFQSTQPWDQAIEELAQELGLTVTADQLVPFTVRAAVGRDTRPAKGMSLKKYVHEDELPPALAAVGADLCVPHHSIDLVYLVEGVDADPATLVPSDPVEVEAIVLLDVTQPLPTLPISDDALLLETYRKVVSGEIDRAPVFLHGPAVA